MTLRIPFYLKLSFLALLGVGNGLVHGQTVDARVEPGIVPVNHTAQYVVSFRGARGEVQLTPPDVPGLVFGANPSRNSRMSIINGRMSSELSYTWAVMAQAEGDFTIPGQSVSVGGNTMEVPAATFRVTPPDEALASYFGLDLLLPEGPLYLGQMFPVTVRFFLQQGVEVSGLGRNWPLEVDVNGLVTTPIPNNANPRSVERGGVRFYEVDFSFYATAVQSGEAVIQVAMPMSYRDPLRRRRGWQNVRLSAQELALDIQPLPREGRPASFSDAVGDFEALAQLSTRELTAGEPLTVTLTVRGSGNFERISAPPLPDTPGWRAFPPKTQFTGADDAGFRGEKTFEYLLIPDDASVTAVPELAFSFFDPSSGLFDEVIFEAEPISVQAAATGPASVRDFAAALDEGPRNTLLLTPEDLRPLLPDLGLVTAPMAPPFSQSGRWALMGGSLIALLAGGWVLRQRQSASSADAQRQRHLRKAARDALRSARIAAMEGDPVAFLTAATAALREGAATFAPRDRQPSSFTWSEIRSWIPSDTWDTATTAALDRLVEQADAAQFAPSAVTSLDLTAARATLEEALQQLGGTRR